jgi:hypothetical protein
MTHDLHTEYESELPQPGLVRYYDDSSIREFKFNLSYEIWENVFDSECDNDVNVILKKNCNTHLKKKLNSMV